MSQAPAQKEKLFVVQNKEKPESHIVECPWSKRTLAENQQDLKEETDLWNLHQKLVPSFVNSETACVSTSAEWKSFVDACHMPLSLQSQIPFDRYLKMDIVINGIHNTAHPTEIHAIAFHYRYGIGNGGSTSFFTTKGGFKFNNSPTCWDAWIIHYLCKSMNPKDPLSILKICQDHQIPVVHHRYHKPCTCLTASFYRSIGL